MCYNGCFEIGNILGILLTENLLIYDYRILSLIIAT